MMPARVHKQNQSLDEKFENYLHSQQGLERAQDIRTSGDYLARQDEIIALLEAHLFPPSCRAYLWFVGPETMGMWLRDGVDMLILQFQKTQVFLEAGFHREPEGDWELVWNNLVPRVSSDIPELGADTIARARAAVKLMMDMPRQPIQCSSFRVMDGSPNFPVRGSVPLFPPLPGARSLTRVRPPTPPRADATSNPTPSRHLAAEALMSLANNSGTAQEQAPAHLYSALSDLVCQPDSPHSVQDSPRSVLSELSSMSGLSQLDDGSPKEQEAPQATQETQNTTRVQPVQPFQMAQKEAPPVEGIQANAGLRSSGETNVVLPSRRRQADSPGEGPSSRRERRVPSPELDLRDYGFFWV